MPGHSRYLQEQCAGQGGGAGADRHAPAQDGGLHGYYSQGIDYITQLDFFFSFQYFQFPEPRTAVRRSKRNLLEEYRREEELTCAKKLSMCWGQA